ncbi:helix-turn-helix domain-containing protein [Heyndrickxia coagulans]|uniref:Helix-turn-helix transcriptional regulator n=1 Tax=Heyndrickxia coagulans TaxID=1398 RepID=A0AAW7C9T3_HEYCO|nr:helix-turn-helix transcriptional regulator [Heyndrickxia coagulans]MDL5040003.1 helix-turn-helix transcriptional regulator [Heyndrickxia coagulans]
MNVSYNKLWKLMIDKNMNKTQLKNEAHLSTNVIAKLGKNETVSINTLSKICEVLQCNIGDIVDFVSNDKEHSCNEGNLRFAQKRAPLV